MAVVPPGGLVALAEAIVSACMRPKLGRARSERPQLNLSKFNLQQMVGAQSKLFSSHDTESGCR